MSLPSAVQRETDPEILRALLDITNTELLKTRELLSKALSLQVEEIRMDLKDELARLKNALFGRGPERIDDRESDRKSEQEVLLHSRALFPAPKNKEFKKLAEEIIVHSMSEAELKVAAVEYTGNKDATGKEFVEMASFYDESEEITIIERSFKKLIHRRKKYKLADEHLPETSPKSAVIIAAPGQERLAPGCKYSIDLAVDVALNKYLLHLPLDRQRREIFKPAGLGSVTAKTLYNLSAMVASHAEEIVKDIRDDILGIDFCVHVDESPWPIHDKDSSNGYIWVLSNMAGTLYRFEPTRNGDVAKEMLSGHVGPVMSDDFSGYNKLNNIDGITRALCMAHARRKFFEIRQNYTEPTKAILNHFSKLFAIEGRAESLEMLATLRQAESQPVIDAIYEWLIQNKVKYLPQSAMAAAINYSLSNWALLTKFLDDPRIPLTNNDAERSIRHAVVGRKNFYGSRTINGADTAATLYTVIETCKRHEIDPRSYLKRLIKDRNHGRKTPTPMQLAKTRLEATAIAG